MGNPNKNPGNPNLNPGNPNIISANPKNKKTAFLFGFSLIIVWISLFLSLDFPDFFENPGNPNKNPGNLNKKLAKSRQKICFLLFGFHRFYIWISRIFVWISPFLLGFHFTGFKFFRPTI
jgi:hypothetical protein